MADEKTDSPESGTPAPVHGEPLPIREVIETTAMPPPDRPTKPSDVIEKGWNLVDPTPPPQAQAPPPDPPPTAAPTPAPGVQDGPPADSGGGE
jgi:hypothetical protein